MVLPQSMMTEWYWSDYTHLPVYVIYDGPDAQVETQMVADALTNFAEELFPVSWDALDQEKSPCHRKW